MWVLRGFYFTAWINLWTALCLTEVDDNNIRSLLTPNEWSHLMGFPSDSEFIYGIAYPILNPIPEAGSATRSLELSSNSIDGKLNLNLYPSPGLVSDDFLMLETFANGSHILNHKHQDDVGCYYRSEKTALNLCGGVRGLLNYDDENVYIINPLPTRFHNDTCRPHVIIKKPIGLMKQDRSECSHLEANQPHRKRKRKNVVMKRREKRSTRDAYRNRRNLFSTESPVFVETAVFVDRDLFEHMKSNYPIDTERELIRFVLAMINAVQLLYHDPSLGRPVNFLLKRLEILKEEASDLSRSPDIDRYLSNFCNWQRTKNPVGDREPQHWDHALILTGLDLYVRGKHGKISSQVVGLAPVAGMCTTTSSCTVNEGRHFESVYVVAHEIGHNLGMRHDGPLADNDCDPSSYIMSPTLGSGKITWSSCSRRYLQKFLDTPQSRCLLDHGSSAGQLDHRAEGALPGERFDADQQCMLKYGRGSLHSSQQPLDDVCRDLHCERERYTWTSHPALEGTLCGHNLWCRGGRCVVKGLSMTASYNSVQASSARLERVDGGWSKWRSFSDCASGCLFGEEGRLRSGSTGIMVATRMCNNPSPQGTGEGCDGVDRKYLACNAQQCHNVPRLTIKEFADQICTRAKEVDKDLNGFGLQRISSDPEEACLVWCQKRNGGTKSRGWTFPDGTVCQTRRSKYGKPSHCINGRCEDFVCDPYEEAQFAQMPDFCPIDREDNEIMFRTGLRRREGASHWVSASGCHFNCVTPGSGIRLVVNKLKSSRSSIQLCQPDQYGCGRVKTAFQHASSVCSKYKERVRRLSGLGMQISPALEDPDRPCRVACQDESISHRFYLVNGEEGWFPFGTDCSRGMSEKKAYCINGKCLEFGVDDTPVSQSEFTLPLLSRTKRSLHRNSTRVTATLHQEDLDEIIDKLNQTIMGQLAASSGKKFDIDLNNPIHVNMDMDPEAMPHKYYRRHEFDYYNYT
ncbi:PREDICTED: A disintegrin and metalloproteinase with thrombospondin motifs 18-like [Nicrophorus vespilloides]|uniref:A disintegrin and metalloproteinase with thrombospondin motifs 18-like n=1 Tax=Nicrophorus vespilloides TaxID=110193 RepID=A0ABM1MQF4_NICVS|nr:PREDICTED: A disintegrin and metalloproteinase with thrombospondin motifs 18-like [Nicrophorus vespilloides]